MSDSLKDRLSSHSNSFEGLLSLIPARYYYNDETSSQWKKNGVSVEEKKAESAANRRQKFDPDVGSSALDETRRREQAAAEKAPAKHRNAAPAEQESSDIEGEGDEDVQNDNDSDVVIYDDHGNVISGEAEETVEQLLRAKAQNPDQGIEEPPAKKGKQLPKNKPSSTAKPIAARNDPRTVAKPTNKPKEVKADVRGPTDDSSEISQETPTEVSDSSPASDGVAASKKSKEGIEELRAKLTARVNELRSRRRAPGSDANGAPRNREELLAARKLRLEQKKNQSLKRKAGVEDHEDNEDDSADEDEMADDGSQLKSHSSSATNGDVDENAKIMFGQIEFGDGARLGKDFNTIEERRKLKKRNAIDQLKVLEGRKQKISKLDKEKQDEIADNAKWSRAILQSEGAKIRDDEKLLRKTIKQKQNRKKRAEKEWKNRIYNVKKGIAGREAKRHANISAHKEAKKLRLKGKKRREHMKKATSS